MQQALRITPNTRFALSTLASERRVAVLHLGLRLLNLRKPLPQTLLQMPLEESLEGAVAPIQVLSELILAHEGYLD